MVLFLLFAACLLLIPSLLLRRMEVLALRKKSENQGGLFGIYARSDLFKGFFDTVILLIFFVSGLAGALAFLFDGIADVMVHYSLTVNDEVLALWWVIPAGFAVAVSLKTVSGDVYRFLKKTAGSLLAFALMIMITGEIAICVGSTNIVMVVNALRSALLYGGYPKGTLLAISKLGDIFVVFGEVLFGGIIAAFAFSFGRGWRNKIERNKL